MQQAILTSVSNPVWADEAHTMIDCMITNTTYGDEKLPFTASPNDPAEHGRKIFMDLINGVYGPIGDYIPPVLEENPV